MSLLNEALRKRKRELEETIKTGFPKKIPSTDKMAGVKKYGIIILFLFAGVFVILGVKQMFFTSGSGLSFSNRQISEYKSAKHESTTKRPEYFAKIQKKSKPEIPGENKAENVAAAIIKNNDQRNLETIPKPKNVLLNKRKDTAKPLKIKKIRADKKTDREKSTKIKSKSVSSPKAENIFYNKAVGYYNLNMFNEAKRLFRQVIRENPKHTDALFNLASVYIKTSSFTEACLILQELAKTDAGNPLITLNLAIAKIGLKKPEEALVYLKMAEKQKNIPRFELYFYQGVALSQLNKPDDALTWYKKAEEFGSDYPQLLFNMAVAYDKLQKYDMAVKYYTAFLNQGISLPSGEKQEVETRIRNIQVYLTGQSGLLW